MEEPTPAVEANEKPVEVTKLHKPHTVVYLIIIVLLIVAGSGAYYWRNDQAAKRQKTDSDRIALLQKQIDDLNKQLEAKDDSSSAGSAPATDAAKTVDNAAKMDSVPTAAVKENVIASIKTGNTAVLEGYMATSVRVVIAASGAASDRTPAQAVADLKYVQNAIAPWDFELGAATLAEYESGDYTSYFESNSVVGKSSDGKVVVFNFDDAGKIDAVFMSIDADLL